MYRVIDLPIDKRPNFIAAYLPEVDQEGHRTGPHSEDVNKYLRYVDAFVASIHSELAKRHLSDIVDVLVVSDHGMTATNNERVIYLDKVLGDDGWQAIEHKEGWPSCGLRFRQGTDESVMYSRLEKAARESNGGFQVFTHQTMPQQWHFQGNSRIAPVRFFGAQLLTALMCKLDDTDVRCPRTWVGRKQYRGTLGHDEGGLSPIWKPRLRSLASRHACHLCRSRTVCTKD